MSTAKPDGTFVGNATWENNASKSKFGNAVYFDGTDDGLSFEDLDELDAPRQFGISIWFKREVDKSGTAIDTNHQINNVLLSQSSGSSNDNLEIGTEGNQVEIYMDSGAWYRGYPGSCKCRYSKQCVASLGTYLQWK